MVKPKIVNVFVGDTNLSICRSEGFEVNIKDGSLINTSVKNRSIFAKFHPFNCIPRECFAQTRDLFWGENQAKGWKAQLIHFDFYEKKKFLPDTNPLLINEVRMLRHEIEMLTTENAALKEELRDINDKDRYWKKMDETTKRVADIRSKFQSDYWGGGLFPRLNTGNE